MKTLKLNLGRGLFGTEAKAYNHYRPDYPAELFKVLEDRCGLGPNISILEIGAGTGQATKQLLKHNPSQLLAIEPDASMAELLKQNMAEAEILEVDITTCEQAIFPQNHFDLGIAAMSFHWVQEKTALTKVESALKPGGWWAMWWTQFSNPAIPNAFHQASRHVFADITPGPTASGKNGNHYAFDEKARLAALAVDFENPSLTEFSWTLKLTPETLRGLYSTFSPLLALDADHRRSALDELERIAREDFAGNVDRPVITYLYTARKKL